MVMAMAIMIAKIFTLIKFLVRQKDLYTIETNCCYFLVTSPCVIRKINKFMYHEPLEYSFLYTRNHITISNDTLKEISEIPDYPIWCKRMS